MALCNCIFYKQLRSLPTDYPSVVIHCQSLKFFVVWFYYQLFSDTFLKVQILLHNHFMNIPSESNSGVE